ncbi:uncharacterized protein LOC120908284 [Anopheles arabiensis]|uniref:uncharacterized protein LOC120908284 n=1 Tax=Anopheles arabiensis TaxID=7173 RepID=UPI001AACFB4B|nr:uncharacterized protein LOC120908284 [Anopheles arabiensis]
MENAKRPKLTLKMIDGKCVMVVSKPQNNDSTTSAAKPILHELKLNAPLHSATTSGNSKTASSCSIPGMPNKQKQVQYKVSRSQSIGTQTMSVVDDNSCLNIILKKLTEIQYEQQQTNEKLVDMEKQIKLMRSELDIVADRVAPSVGIVRATSFEFEPVGTKDELDDLELKLVDNDFKNKMEAFVDARLPTDSVDARLHASMDILFKKEFVVNISWSGIGHPNPKIPFNNYKNILKFYKYIGTCQGLIPMDQKIKEVLQNKFRHSKQRLELVGLVKTSHHRHKKY